MKNNRTILYRKTQKPHPRPLPRREGSDVHCELMWNGNRLSIIPLPSLRGRGWGWGFVGFCVGLCVFLYGAFFIRFPKGLLLPSKTNPFTFQKDSFCNPKRTLLQPKRTPFFLVFNF